MACIAFYGILSFMEIAQIGRGLSETGEEATIAYRGELLYQYYLYALQKPLWGWGIQLWPKVPGLASVDNHYLWLMLKHGLIAVGLLVFMMIFSLIRLLRRGISDSPSQTADCSLAFMFAAVVVSFIMGLTTVYMGLQLEPLFFLLLGWIEGFLLLKPYGHFLEKVSAKRKSVKPYASNRQDFV